MYGHTTTAKHYMITPTPPGPIQGGWRGTRESRRLPNQSVAKGPRSHCHSKRLPTRERTSRTQPLKNNKTHRRDGVEPTALKAQPTEQLKPVHNCARIFWDRTVTSN